MVTIVAEIIAGAAAVEANIVEVRNAIVAAAEAAKAVEEANKRKIFVFANALGL